MTPLPELAHVLLYVVCIVLRIVHKSPECGVYYIVCLIIKTKICIINNMNAIQNHLVDLNSAKERGQILGWMIQGIIRSQRSCNIQFNILSSWFSRLVLFSVERKTHHSTKCLELSCIIYPSRAEPEALLEQSIFLSILGIVMLKQSFYSFTLKGTRTMVI